MRICNVMFGCGLGGIEQAFVDYSRALKEQGHQVTALIHPKAAIANTLAKYGISIQRFANMGQWDPFVVKRLRAFIHSPQEPDIIITHGNRAAVLMRKAVLGKIPVVGVCHNYSIRKILTLDGALVITKDLEQIIQKAGMKAEKVFHMPNMIDTGKKKEFEKLHYGTPPVIGTMGRLVKKKGFDVFLKALAELKARKVEFKAVIGGTGKEEKKLESLCWKLGLKEEVTFVGWIEDKKEFFDNMDIFCLPSQHEPFGIVLLESFLHGKPIITTASEGPREIVTDGQDGLVTPIGDVKAMADALEQLVTNKTFAQTLAENAFNKVHNEYAMDKLGQHLSAILPQARREWKKGA